jgi:hypothetical protein
MVKRIFLRKLCFGLLGAGIILFSINAYTGDRDRSSGDSANTDRWEYKVLELNIVYGYSDVNSETLNDLGKQGWDLAFVTVGHQSNISPTHLFTFKRKLP